MSAYVSTSNSSVTPCVSENTRPYIVEGGCICKQATPIDILSTTFANNYNNGTFVLSQLFWIYFAALCIIY